MALLGHIVETVGAGEGFGVAIVDDKEIWYLETGSGHQWMAQRLPNNQYFATGNRGRLQDYDPQDPNMMASKNTVEFASEKACTIRPKTANLTSPQSIPAMMCVTVPITTPRVDHPENV